MGTYLQPVPQGHGSITNPGEKEPPRSSFPHSLSSMRLCPQPALPFAPPGPACAQIQPSPASVKNDTGSLSAATSHSHPAPSCENPFLNTALSQAVSLPCHPGPCPLPFTGLRVVLGHISVVRNGPLGTGLGPLQKGATSVLNSAQPWGKAWKTS